MHYHAVSVTLLLFNFTMAQHMQDTKSPSPQRYPPVPPQTTATTAKSTAAVRSPNKATAVAATTAGNGSSSSDDAVAFQFNLGFAEDDLPLTITESDVSAVLRLGKTHTTSTNMYM
jgi:hypothetical protein